MSKVKLFLDIFNYAAQSVAILRALIKDNLRSVCLLGSMRTTCVLSEPVWLYNVPVLCACSCKVRSSL